MNDVAVVGPFVAHEIAYKISKSYIFNRKVH